MIKAGIIGGAGYTGGELIRILLNHPDVLISFVQSKSNAGNKISSIHTDLEGDTELVFSKEMDENVDVIFFCTGHGESTALLPALNIPTSIKIIPTMYPETDTLCMVSLKSIRLPSPLPMLLPIPDVLPLLYNWPSYH